MSKKKSYVPSRRMTKTELMLAQIMQQDGPGHHLIDMKKYDEPRSAKENRRRKYKRKRKYFEKKGLNIYEKLKLKEE